MRTFFAVTLAALFLFSVAAWRLQPRLVEPGKTPLVWTSDDNPTRREQISLFNRLNPDISLRLDPNNAGMEKVIVQSLAGVGPDVFDCYDGFQLSAYVRAGIAVDVSRDLARAGIDVRRDLWSAATPNFMLDGRAYGFPTNVAVNGIWFNKDLFDRAGIPYPRGPWKWDTLVRVAQRLTQRDARGRIRQFGLVCDWYNWPHFVLQWGGRVYSPNGTRCVVDGPRTIAAIQFMHDLIYRYRVMPSPVEEAAMATQGGWGSGTITQFGAGRAAMALGGRWWLCTLRDYKRLRLGAVESPHLGRRVFRGYGRATLVNRTSPRRAAAIRFLLYEAGRPYNELVNAQADGIAPVIRFAYTPAYLHNPAHPEEDYNAVWRDMMREGVPDQVSPFVNGQAASRILNKQLDLVKNDQKSAAAAMRTAARLVNEEIQKTLDEDPSLRRRYDELTRGTAP